MRTLEKRRVVIGMTGATGAIYGIRLLELLREHSDCSRHLIISPWAEETITYETGYTVPQVRSLADEVYDVRDLAAPVSSGSFQTLGMVVLPCSMKTLSAIAHGYDDNLIVRAADVTIKEGRPLVLCPRESPLSAIHLENMLKLSRLGVKLVPPMPNFYQHPATIDDLVRYQVIRTLDQLGLHLENAGRWGEGGDYSGSTI